MSFALCYVLINCFIFFMIRFMLFLFCVLCFLFCVFCVFVLFCVFLPMYIVVYFLLVYNFTDHCHRVETQLQLINIIYHIVYSTTYIAISHYRFISYNLKLSHLRNICNTHEKKFLAEFRIMYMVIGHLPSPFWSQWCFSCHHTVNGRFMFRDLSRSCSAFCEDAGITNFVRVSNNTGFQNPAVVVTSTLKVSRGRLLIIGIKRDVASKWSLGRL
jgi:hypothetical protein